MVGFSINRFHRLRIFSIPSCLKMKPGDTGYSNTLSQSKPHGSSSFCICYNLIFFPDSCLPGIQHPSYRLPAVFILLAVPVRGMSLVVCRSACLVSPVSFFHLTIIGVFKVPSPESLSRNTGGLKEALLQPAHLHQCKGVECTVLQRVHIPVYLLVKLDPQCKK